MERFFLPESKGGIEADHASRLRLILSRLHANQQTKYDLWMAQKLAFAAELVLDGNVRTACSCFRMSAEASPELIDLSHRLATPADAPQIAELMRVSILENMKPFLSSAELEAAQETMGVDRTLIEDKTYFVVETVVHDQTILVGCGGWGKRKTLYGGDHTVGRDDSYCDPAVDAARIRAMYTHPSWVRRGIGTLLLELGEESARGAGFKTIELGATIAGEPFYLARGYKEVDRETHMAANGANNVVIKMVKNLW